MRIRLESVVSSIVVLLGATGFAAGAALHGWAGSAGNASGSHPFAEFETNHELELLRRQSKEVPLRILPLGASIVNGIGSTSGNGFRKPLRDALRFDGWQVNMVGTEKSGDMQDWDNEGHPGAIIKEEYGYFTDAAGYKANVVLINLGTNDANRAIDPDHAGERMKVLLNQIWNTEDMADTCIILSTLIPSGVANGIEYQPTINRQYRQLVADLRDIRCIYLADMDPETGSAADWIRPDLNSDGIHPNDNGHQKMAFIFWKAILNAANSGKIVTAPTIDTDVPAGCDKALGNGVYAGALTQLGSGIDDGIYYHDSQGMGTLLEVTSDWDRNQWRFARLYGRQYDDFVGWFEKSADEHAFGVWKNFGDGRFEKIADMDPDLFCIPSGLHFIDMNADGYDDIVCIDADGNAYLSINQRDGTDTTPPTFKRVSSTALIKQNEGYPQARVRLADIDGDGRGDYCIIDDGGNIHCWRNGWVNDIPEYWQSLGQRFNAKGKGNITGVRFEDINGDGRDDWIWISDVGEVETWTSARSCKSGKDGDGLNVAWRQGFHKGMSSGYTHYGLATEADSGLRDRILFGRVFGEPQDFGLLGRQDYVYLAHNETADGTHKFTMKVWKNIGFGGTKLKADGNKYCNMLGHDDGREDYVWTLSTGRMTLYPNNGRTHLTTGQSFWGPSAIIWDPVKLIGKELNRRDLHLMDWNGDGTCDIVWVNPDNENRPSVWLNHYRTTKNWDSGSTWEYYADPPSARAADVHCSETRGLDIHDLPVRFGDIDGNKRDDFLCIEKDGRVTAYLHSDDNSWKSIGQVKFPEGKDRANLRWADVNGDGKDDMLWVDKFNGDATVYYNRGMGNPADLGGSAIKWDKTNGPVYDGNHAGTCLFYPDLDGNGRADMHSLLGTFDNRAETWFNPSCGLTDREGDDAGCCADPQLPVQPGSDDGGNECVSGHGPDDFNSLCEFTCHYGFCPSPCVCDEYGTPDEAPAPAAPAGYPASDKGREYAELCAWVCARSTCPTETCQHHPGGIFIQKPVQEGDPNWVTTGCTWAPNAQLTGCNIDSLTETPPKFDPFILKQDCSNPAEAVYPWQCACNDCSVAGAESSKVSPIDRWNAVYAEDCLKDVTFWYSVSFAHLDEADKSLPDAVGREWGGIGTLDTPCAYRSPKGFHCDVIGDSGCRPVKCGTTSYAALDLVLQSFYSVFNTHNKMYDSLDGVANTLVSQADSLHETFANNNPKTILENIQELLSVLDVVFAAAGAGIWSKLLNAGVFDALTETASKGGELSGALNQAVAVYKLAGGDATTAKEKDMQDADTIEKAAQVFVDGAKESLDSFMKFIYSGDDVYGTAALQSLLSNGVFLDDPSAGSSTLDFAKEYLTSARVKLIELAWSLGVEQNPVVLYDRADVKNPLEAEVELIRETDFSDSDAAKTRYPGNFEASDGKKYSLWLVGAHVRGTSFEDHYFEPLKGHDQLDEDDNEWGVTWRDYIESSFTGFIMNGKKNPYPFQGPDHLEYGDSTSNNFFALQKGPSSPGFIKLPVCTVYLAFENLLHYEYFADENEDPCEEYPCCRITWDIQTATPCQDWNDICDPDEPLGFR